MADLAQLDLKAKGGEARLRALLEDLVSYYKGVYLHPPLPQPLALAVWFGRSAERRDQDLLVLFAGSPLQKVVSSEHQSLLWKTGVDEPPFANIHATSVEFFSHQIVPNTESLNKYRQNFEVLYFDKALLPDSVLRAFDVITEPPGLIKGWYVTADQYSKSQTIRNLLASHGQARPAIGLVKTEESPDFENCRGIIHLEFSQKWLPVSPGGLTAYTFYNDFQDGRPGYFLFQGGSFYSIVKIEVKTAPEYSARVLEKLRDDRYPEVYLRAVYPPEQPAA